MIFSNPEIRRGLRNLAMIAVVAVLLFFVWQWADRFDLPTLREAMRWSLGIVALFALGVGMENGLRAFKLSIGKDGASAEASGDGE